MKHHVVNWHVTVVFLPFFVFLVASTVYWLPRDIGIPTEGAFDAYTYATLVAEGDERVLEAQPFLAPYFNASSWIAPEFFAPLLHLALILPALMLLALNSFGSRLLVPVTAALLFPEFLLFLGSVSKEGLAIAGVVWLVVAFAAYRSGLRFGALVALGIAAAVFELSRPYFSVVPLGSLAIAMFFNARTRVKAWLLFWSLVALTSVYFSHGELIDDVLDTASDKLAEGLAFLTWFEENMASDSAVKNFVRQLLSIGLLEIESPAALIPIALIGVIAKAAIYSFAIPLIAPPSFELSPSYLWALSWQIGASITSVFVLVYFFKHLPRQMRTLPRMDRLLVVFALVFAISMAASTFIFHVRYRAPAEFLLLVLAVHAMQLRVRSGALIVLANFAILVLASALVIRASI